MSQIPGAHGTLAGERGVQGVQGVQGGRVERAELEADTGQRVGLGMDQESCRLTRTQAPTHQRKRGAC